MLISWFARPRYIGWIPLLVRYVTIDSLPSRVFFCDKCCAMTDAVQVTMYQLCEIAIGFMRGWRMRGRRLRGRSRGGELGIVGNEAMSIKVSVNQKDRGRRCTY